jgi:hypothetical protein
LPDHGWKDTPAALSGTGETIGLFDADGSWFTDQYAVDFVAAVDRAIAEK